MLNPSTDCIPSAEGKNSFKEPFDKRNSKNVATKVITPFSTLVLTLNIFVHVQMKVCAMGTICRYIYIYIYIFNRYK